MGTPFPNPENGAAAEKDEGASPGPGRRPPRPRRPTAQRRRRDILAPTGAPPQTKFQYVHLDPRNLPGPSGIKQCFRAVKSLRRIPVLPKVEPAPKRVETVERAPEPPKKHDCRFCDKKFNSPGKLSQHVLSHTGELPFGCEHCDKRFNSKFKLVRHGLIHNETRQFSCRYCDKTFHRKDHLANHERIHNPLKNVYECEKESCKKRYTSLLSFRKHTALHSAEEGNLECKICSKVFETREDIVYHLKVHAGSRTVKNENDKKFNCDYCERKFFTAKDVRRHLVVHTGRRDFLCQFCPQKFGRKDHLVRHVKKAHPDEQWQSSTPGTSSSLTVEQLKPLVVVPETKKGKSDVKKSKSKGDSKQMKRETKTYQSATDSKSERTLTREITASQEEVYRYGPGTEALPTSSGLLKQSQPIYLPCERLEEIKVEPISEDIKLEENIMTIEDMPSIVTLSNVESASSTSDLSSDPNLYQNMLFMNYPYLVPQTEILLGENISYTTRTDEGYMGRGDLVAVESSRNVLSLLEQPEVSTLLIDDSERSVSMTDPLQIMQISEPGTSSGTTVLPTFNQAFQTPAQSPKPPQHPPK